MGFSWSILQAKGRGLAVPELPGLCLVLQGLHIFFSFKQNIQKRAHTARSGIQGSARALPATSGSLSLAELSSCRGERQAGREGRRFCHGVKGGLKWGWDSGMLLWVGWQGGAAGQR